MLTLLAHGSPDPRHARDIQSLTARLTAAGIPARSAYLDHHSPSPVETAHALVAAGETATTVVPLLIGSAYHARVDVPLAVAAMRSAAPELAVAAAEPVGVHALLMRAAAELAADTSVGPRTGIVLAAAGSRDARAAAAIESVVRRHAASLAGAVGARAVRAAYLDGGRPLGRIITLMRCLDGCTSFVVVPLVVADGVLRDRIVTAAEWADVPVVPSTLAHTEALLDLIVLRAGSAPAPARGAGARAWL